MSPHLYVAYLTNIPTATNSYLNYSQDFSNNRRSHSISNTGRLSNSTIQHEHSHVPIPSTVKRVQKPLPPIPNPTLHPYRFPTPSNPSYRPSSYTDIGHPSSSDVGHNFAATDIGHNYASTDIAHDCVWTDAGHTVTDSPSTEYNPFLLSPSSSHHHRPPQAHPPSSSPDLTKIGSTSRPKKAQSDIGHSSCPPSFMRHSLLVQHSIPNHKSPASSSFLPVLDALPPPPGSSHSHLSPPSTPLTQSKSRKLRKQPRPHTSQGLSSSTSTSLSASDPQPDPQPSRRRHGMDVEPTAIVVSPLGPPVIALPLNFSYYNRSSSRPTYQQNRPPPLPLPTSSAAKEKLKEKESEKDNNKPTSRKARLMRPWTLNLSQNQNQTHDEPSDKAKAKSRPVPVSKSSSSSVSASASQEGSTSTYTSTAATTPSVHDHDHDPGGQGHVEEKLVSEQERMSGEHRRSEATEKGRRESLDASGGRSPTLRRCASPRESMLMFSANVDAESDIDGEGGERRDSVVSDSSAIGPSRSSLALASGGKKVGRKLTKRKRGGSVGAISMSPSQSGSAFAARDSRDGPAVRVGNSEFALVTPAKRPSSSSGLVRADMSATSPGGGNGSAWGGEDTREKKESPSNGGRSKGRSLKKRRPDGIVPSSPTVESNANTKNVSVYLRSIGLDASSSSSAFAAASAFSPVSTPVSPSSPSSSFLASPNTLSPKSRNKSKLSLLPSRKVQPPRVESEEAGGGFEWDSTGESWDPYEAHGGRSPSGNEVVNGKWKGKGIERKIVEELRSPLPSPTFVKTHAEGSGSECSLPPPPRLRERRESPCSEGFLGVDEMGGDRDGPMRRWTMAFGDDEDGVEGSAEGGLAGIGSGRVRILSKGSSGTGRSRAGSGSTNGLLSVGMRESVAGEELEEGSGESGGTRSNGVGIALTTPTSRRVSAGESGSLGRSQGRYRCSYDPRGSLIVYGGYQDDDDEEEDDDEDEEMGEDREKWLSERRAKLCCRDLVRTERNYLRCLRDLMDGQTQNKPSPLLLAYLPALLTASNSFLAHLSSDPTPYGVSAAFLGCEDELEAAFVAWCGIVGSYFVDGNSSRGRKSNGPSKDPLLARSRTKSGFGIGKGLPGVGGLDIKVETHRGSLPLPSDIGGSGMFTAALATGLKFPLAPINVNSVSGNENGSPGALKKTVNTWRKSMPALSNLVVTHGGGGVYGSGTGATGKNRKSMYGSAFYFAESEGEKEVLQREKKRKEKKPSVRDLAIQPVQRVMRYVLQYKDLLNHTSASSPARALVDRALESATRIAAKCDRAQDNAAFLRRS